MILKLLKGVISRITNKSEHEQNRELYIGNIHYHAKPFELRQLFENHGSVESLKIIRDPRTKRSKGYGFVKFYAQKDADKALKATNGKPFKGRELCVAYSKNSDNE